MNARRSMALAYGAAVLLVAGGTVLPWPLIARRTRAHAPLAPSLPPDAGEVLARPAMIILPLPGGPVIARRGDDYRDETKDYDVTYTLSVPFAIAETEVTQAQYQAVMGENPSSDKKCGGACPVENVSFVDAARFCNALSARESSAGERLDPCYLVGTGDVTWSDPEHCTGYRLPTEAEWEYAARAGSPAGRYAGSSTDACKLGNVADRSEKAVHPGFDTFECDDHHAGIAPVRSYEANAFELFDMTGNVDEWVWDWYDAAYRPKGESDPRGPTTGWFRVNRGGSWYSGPAVARLATRLVNLPANRDGDLGFRVARSFPSSVFPFYPLPGRIVLSYREGDKTILRIDNESGAGVQSGDTGSILEGFSGVSRLPGGSFTITDVIDQSHCVARTSLPSVMGNARVLIDTGRRKDRDGGISP